MSSPVRRKNPGWLGSLMTRYRAIADREIAVGFPRGKAQAYPDGESVVEVAYRHVEGIGVPVRDFMAYAEPGIKEKTNPILKEIAKAANAGKDSVVEALQEAAGIAGADAIKEAINAGEYEPNAPATVAAKGSSKPLIDTSHMMQSVTYVVREKQ